MDKCTTPAAPEQAQPFPRVSSQLLVRINVRNDARRHGVNPVPAMQAAAAEYIATRGNRFAARRAGFAAVDLQCGRAKA